MVAFPLLLIPLAVCNIISFLMPGVALSTQLFSLQLMSGVTWSVTLSDVLIALGLVLLLFEIIKAGRARGKNWTDHFLSLVVFGAATAEFVLLKPFGTSTFFLLTLMALVDLLSGLVLRARRRPVVAESRIAPARETGPEPRFTPEPVHPLPSATPAREPQPALRVEPSVVAPVASAPSTPQATTPQVPTPAAEAAPAPTPAPAAPEINPPAAANDTAADGPTSR